MKSQFIKKINEIGAGGSHTWQIFSDFCEMFAITLHSPVNHSKELEDRYLQIINNYDQKYQSKFCELAGMTVQALEEDPNQDFLGNCFEEMQLSNHWTGQFFTPYAVSKMLGQMNVGGLKEVIEKNGIITLHEPACGSGSCIIALANSLKESGINYQESLFVSCVDVDFTCFCMSYIQLSLLGVPAEVIHGNSLSMKIYRTWLTMFGILNKYKINRKLDPVEISADKTIKQSSLEAWF